MAGEDEENRKLYPLQSVYEQVPLWIEYPQIVIGELSGLPGCAGREDQRIPLNQIEFDTKTDLSHCT